MQGHKGAEGDQPAARPPSFTPMAEAKEMRALNETVMLFIRHCEIAMSCWSGRSRLKGDCLQRLLQTWPSSGHMAHPLGPPPHPLAGCPARTLPRALQGCLPVCSTAAGPVRRGQERSRVQPGGRSQVVGVAPPLGSATHLGGQRRIPGSRPAGGALPILQGSGHYRRPGGAGVMGDPARGENEIVRREARCGLGSPSALQSLVLSPGYSAVVQSWNLASLQPSTPCGKENHSCTPGSVLYSPALEAQLLFCEGINGLQSECGQSQRNTTLAS
ncbi:uncharacterized protein LOC104649896 [Saimiri boliviensis]|uniref:uncharacterized protein LOC104649896 n=1 Tax=Saimiri boliviensis TaxID=27679 RepID=UPI003D77A67A